MNQNKQLWLLTLLLIAMLGGGALATGFSAARSAQARQTDGQRKEKWEHCAISIYPQHGIDSLGRSIAVVEIRYFDLNGSREETVEGREENQGSSKRGASGEAMAKTIGKLGNEGWEMVGREGDTIYFKRLKQ